MKKPIIFMIIFYIIVLTPVQYAIGKLDGFVFFWGLAVYLVMFFFAAMGLGRFLNEVNKQKNQ